MILLCLLFLCCRASAVIYQLNATEYARMPPVYHFDPYEICIEEEGGTYCVVDMNLVADEETDLLNMIKHYSDRTETHFNHTHLRYGVCVTKMCDDYIQQNRTDDVKLTIERCLNDTFWKKYQLKTKVDGDISCNHGEEKIVLTSDDIIVAMICLSFVLLNIFGTIYDLLSKKDTKGNKWFLCFSMKQNWRKLTAPSGENADLRTRRLKGLNGMRFLTIFLVITIHSLLPFVLFVENMHVFESSYSNAFYHLIFDGTMLVQTFFIISGCLLAYYFQIISEKQNINWIMLPKGILLRWLRLTPPYAVVLAISMTLARYAGSGPLWHKTIDIEVQECRLNGWMNLIYINNYYDTTQCMVHTWYLAADMQLFILGLVVLILAKSNHARKIVLPLLLVVSLIFPALHTYLQNLYAFLIVTPEFSRALFRHNPTFNNTYKRGHTNMTCYIFGMSVGLIIYYLQNNQFDIKRYKKFRYLYWGIVPVSVAAIFCSGLFYSDGVAPSLIITAIYSSIWRVIAGILGSVFVIGMVFKLEDVYRSVLEWRGWTTPARVSYAAYLLHMMVVHVLIGSRTTLIRQTTLQIFLLIIGTSFLSFIIAVPFWLLFEAPISQLIKLVLSIGKKKITRPDAEIGYALNEIKTQTRLI